MLRMVMSRMGVERLMATVVTDSEYGGDEGQKVEVDVQGKLGGGLSRVQDQLQWRILDWDAKTSGSSQWQTGLWATRAE